MQSEAKKRKRGCLPIKNGLQKRGGAQSNNVAASISDCFTDPNTTDISAKDPDAYTVAFLARVFGLTFVLDCLFMAYNAGVAVRRMTTASSAGGRAAAAGAGDGSAEGGQEDATGASAPLFMRKLDCLDRQCNLLDTV